MSIPPNQVSRELKDVSTSALELERSADAVESSADRSTQLAAIRTILAADRTYAAWIRTALTALASGVGAKALLSGVVPSWLANFAGSVMVIFCVGCLAASIWRGMYAGVPPALTSVKRIPSWALIVTNGFLLFVAIAALIGIWFFDPKLT